MRKIILLAALLVVWSATPASAQYAHSVIFVKNHAVVPGHKFIVSGISFAPDETIVITFGGLCGTGAKPGDRVIGMKKANKQGKFHTLAAAIPPGTAPNTYGVRATGNQGSFTCTDVFVIGAPKPHPTMGLAPSTIIPSERPTVSGAGFVAGESVTLTLGRACGHGGATGDLNLGAATVGSNGKFSTLASPIPPGTATGTYGLRARGATGDLSCANVFVRPAHHTSSTPTLLHVNRTTGITSVLVASGGLVLLRTRRREPGSRRSRHGA